MIYLNMLSNNKEEKKRNHSVFYKNLYFVNIHAFFYYFSLGFPNCLESYYKIYIYNSQTKNYIKHFTRNYAQCWKLNQIFSNHDEWLTQKTHTHTSLKPTYFSLRSKSKIDKKKWRYFKLKYILVIRNFCNTSVKQ